MSDSRCPTKVITGKTVQLVDLQRQYREIKREIDSAVESVFSGGGFVLGREVELFEQEFAAYCGADYCVGVGSGLDALTLALKGVGVGPGDEVILPGNTFIATALAVTHAGATPVLVDHDPQSYTMRPGCFAAAINQKTKAVIPVHLYGQTADMDAINAIAAEHGVIVVEDAAQAHGATYGTRRCGSLGAAAAFSFYPGKNLGGAGDGGAVVTNDGDLAEWLRRMRNYGSKVKYQHDLAGGNTRLDTIQAAVLRVKLRHLDRWNDLRRDVAKQYDARLSRVPITLPTIGAKRSHVYHLYVIRCARRDELLAYLNERGVAAGIHYPLPIHRQGAYRDRCIVPKPLDYTEAYASQVLSLPIHPHMTSESIDTVIQCLYDFSDEVLVSHSQECTVATAR